MIKIDKYYRIERITHRNGADCTDGEYPFQIGRRVKLQAPISLGAPLLLEYQPRNGEDYHEIMRMKTSTVEGSQFTITGGEVVTTMNSVYYIEPEDN